MCCVSGALFLPSTAHNPRGGRPKGRAQAIQSVVKLTTQAWSYFILEYPPVELSLSLSLSVSLVFIFSSSSSTQLSLSLSRSLSVCTLIAVIKLP